MTSSCQQPLLGPPAIIGLTIAGVVAVEAVLLLLGWLVIVRTRRPRRTRARQRSSPTGDGTRREEARRPEEGVTAQRSPASGRGSFLQRWIVREGNMVYSPVRFAEEPEERTLVEHGEFPGLHLASALSLSLMACFVLTDASSVPKLHLVPPTLQHPAHLYPQPYLPYDHPVITAPPPPSLPPQLSCYSPDRA